MSVNISLLQKVLPFIKSNIDTITTFAGPYVKETYILPGYATNIEIRRNPNEDLSESEKAFIEELKKIPNLKINLNDVELKEFFYTLSQDKCRKPFGITKGDCSKLSDTIVNLIKSITNLKSIDSAAVTPPSSPPPSPPPTPSAPPSSISTNAKTT